MEKMEYRPQKRDEIKVKPRLIIHGGAGNIQPDKLGSDKYALYHALLSIVSTTNAYMTTPVRDETGTRLPTALEIATHAVVLLENNPLFNSGHGAVFTRDGLNELEASVMVSRGFAKRGVGLTGLRRVKNPILLARKMLEAGDDDLKGKTKLGWVTGSQGGHSSAEGGLVGEGVRGDEEDGLDVPSAQGHTLIHGKTAEALAKRYGCEMVDPSYFFTKQRWDEHVRALESKPDTSRASISFSSATWSQEEYLPQGTCGAVALDSEGVICAATSTGGMTNKLTGRIGDTPSIGAGFWAEEWKDPETGQHLHSRTTRLGGGPWENWRQHLELPGPVVELSNGLQGLLADCLPSPSVYRPLSEDRKLVTTRAAALSGTGNGDSFLRVAAVRTVVGMARWASLPASDALNRVAGRGGDLQKSAGDRWGKTGEGEGGMIGIEVVVVKDKVSGQVVESRGEILQDFNCGGMFRAWIHDDGRSEMRIWDGAKDRDLLGEKR
ncbi:putative 20S proteasome subunit alpha type 2 [Xylariales sp. AK1849]|nr:putative 20S proteasome subunit alpha type 2 [Xylariales sp. AK1849]